MTRRIAARLHVALWVALALAGVGSGRALAARPLEAVTASISAIPGQEMLLLELVRPRARGTLAATVAVSVRDETGREVLASESPVVFESDAESADPVIRLRNPGEGVYRAYLRLTDEAGEVANLETEFTSISAPDTDRAAAVRRARLSPPLARAARPEPAVRGSSVPASWRTDRSAPRDGDAGAALAHLKSLASDTLRVDPRPVRTREAASTAALSVERVEFSSLGGARVTGFLVLPRRDPGRVYPGVVMLHGYNQSFPAPPTGLASRGLAVLALDFRHHGKSAPATPIAGDFGLVGMDSPFRYELRNLIGDAIQATRVLSEIPGVDPERLVIHGQSMGGGLALLATAALEAADDGPEPVGVAADVPFLCDFDDGFRNATAGPYVTFREHIASAGAAGAAMRRTLSFFEVSGIAHAITVPAFVTVGLQDSICPPEAILRTMARLGGPHAENVRAEAGHAGGTDTIVRADLEGLDRLLGGKLGL